MFKAGTGRRSEEVIPEVRRTLSRRAGVVRTPGGLNRAEEHLNRLITEGSGGENASIIDRISAEAAVFVGLAIVRAAMNRRESRGSHMYFEDEDDTTPVPSDEPGGRVWNAVRIEGNRIVLSQMQIPTRGR